LTILISRTALPLLLLVAACASPGPPAEQEEGRHLGLFYDDEPPPPTEARQVRPFYSRYEDERSRRVNVLWPFYRDRRTDSYRRISIFPNVVYQARHTPKDRRTWWFVFFPFLFLGHDDFLVFPIGGYSHGLLGQSQIILVTPFYARTKQVSTAATDPVVFTQHFVFWPFIAWGSDKQPGGRRKFRIAPFYGRTIDRNDVRRGFIMWPFFTWRQTRDTRAWMLFPFYGRSFGPTFRETTILFPFYSRRVDFITGATDTALWPFWRRARGTDDVYVSRLWPVSEWRRVDWTTTRYVAWPFWRRKYLDTREQFARFSWIVPFYKHVWRVDRRTGAELKKTSIWPLARWERRPDGTREVAIPILSPIDSPVLREGFAPYRPFISIWHRTTKPNGDRYTTAAFGLYIARREGATRKVRLLTGLIGWDRTPKGRYLRLLWGLRLRIGS
jgi:hypothetical protein